MSTNANPRVIPPRIERFLADEDPPTPCLVIDLEVVEERYRALASALPGADVYYAVKANPSPGVLARLAALGSRFDVASPAEVALCLAAGVDPSRISYGNTIKKRRDIADAFAAGVRLFVVDSEEELGKVAAAAPGATVLVRILVSGEGADWPLSRKFGCEPDMAVDLLVQAATLGLAPAGVSFHVGSQQKEPQRWDPALQRAALVLRQARAAGVGVNTVNIGGGFPANYSTDVPDISAYGRAIEAALRRHLADVPVRVLCEPGRYIAGDAGVLRASVVLVSRKGYGDEHRWVYLDIGRFGGLAETEGEAIRYQLVTSQDGGPVGPVILAGPTCDSVDVLYERTRYRLPLTLTEGDTVDILAAGAYTAAYASAGFNGFGPLTVHELG
ncbi:MAG: type III PLP-dependent enzyme [Acidimicrobiales bacterium]